MRAALQPLPGHDGRIGRGRPLRFLLLVALGWTGARAAALWHETGSLPTALRETLSLPLPARAAAPAPPGAVPPPPQTTSAIRGHAARRRPASAPDAVAPRPRPDPLRIRLAQLGFLQFATYAAPVGPPLVTFDGPAPRGAQADSGRLGGQRWTAAAWLVARPGTGIGTAPGASQIGGSQAGVQVARTLAAHPAIDAFARYTAPLRGTGREAAIGLAWRPGAAPLRLVAEQRFALDGGTGGPGLGIVAGADGVPLAAGFRLEAYGQAGMVARARIEPYADGAARGMRELGGTGGVRFTLGAGAWGAAQRDAQRIDIGPSAALALPVGGTAVRIALDWRQRVAGAARPGSGLALTVGSDF